MPVQDITYHDPTEVVRDKFVNEFLFFLIGRHATPHALHIMQEYFVDCKTARENQYCAFAPASVPAFEFDRTRAGMLAGVAGPEPAPVSFYIVSFCDGRPQRPGGFFAIATWPTGTRVREAVGDHPRDRMTYLRSNSYYTRIPGIRNIRAPLKMPICFHVRSDLAPTFRLTGSFRDGFLVKFAFQTASSSDFQGDATRGM